MIFSGSPSLAGIFIPVRQGITTEQYSAAPGGMNDRRMLNGRGTRTTHYQKTRVVISGSGRLPPGLAALDRTIPQVLKCGLLRSVASPVRAITLPATRRADFEPWGVALVDGEEIKTPGDLVGDVYTVNEISGATQYQVFYLAQYTVYIKTLDDNGDVPGGTHQWSIDCEEV